MNGKAEIRKWSSIFVALIVAVKVGLPFTHVHAAWARLLGFISLTRNTPQLPTVAVSMSANVNVGVAVWLVSHDINLRASSIFMGS